MKVCKNCEHVKIVSDVEGPFCTMFCTKFYDKDYIDGHISYKRCSLVRDASDPECPHWEKKQSIWKKIFKK